MNCYRCNSKLSEGKSQCRACKAWNMQGVQINAGINGCATDGSILLEDVISADEDRIETGPWDKCFGTVVKDDGEEGISGIVRGSVNLIGGTPGAGKSTLFLQLAESVIHKYAVDVLYISAEEQ